MLSRNTILIASLLWTALSASSLAIDAQPEDEIDTNDLDKYLKEGEVATNLHLKGKEIVVLVGSTGTGKSTLSKFIRKHPTLRVAKLDEDDDDEDAEWIFVDGEDTIGSKNAHKKSKTFFPNVDVDTQSGNYIVDCAGFEDTRSPAFDLIAAFLNKRILDTAERLKILIVENHVNLQLAVSRSGFTSTLEHVAKLIGSNLHSFNGSLGVIATKIENKRSDKHVIKNIKDFLSKTKDYLENEQKKAQVDGDNDFSMQIYVLTCLLEGEGKVAIFRRPEESGNPWENESLAKNHQQIRQLAFQELVFASAFNQTFKVAVAPKTINYINEKVLVMTDNKTDQLFSELQKSILLKVCQERQPDASTAVEYFQNQLAYLENLDSFSQILSFCQRNGVEETLIRELVFQVGKYRFLYEVIDKDFHPIEAKIVDLYGHKKTFCQHLFSTKSFFTFQNAINYELENSYNVQVQADVISKKFESETLGAIAATLQTLGFNASTTLMAHKLDLSAITSKNEKDLRKSVKERTDNPVVQQKVGDGQFVFRGRFLILSNILDEVYQISRNAKELILVASQKLFIDCDLELKRIHLTLLAPLVEIVRQKRQISLKGEHGFPLVQGTANHSASRYSAGEDGRTASPGYSSGNFRLVSLDILNPELLSVRSEGGNGGHGEHGGNGYNAVGQEDYPKIHDYRFDHFEEITEIALSQGYEAFGCEGYTDVQWISRTEFLVVNYKNILRSCSIILRDERQYERPTNGGNAGNAGSGAPAGVQTFVVKSNAAEYVSQRFINGRNGNPGHGGKAGKDAPSCKMTEYYCSSNKISRDLIMIIPIFRSAKPYECEERGRDICEGKKVLAIDGSSGKIVGNHEAMVGNLDVSALIAYNAQIVQENRSVENDRMLEEHLNYILNSHDFLDSRGVEKYLRFIESLDGLIAVSNNLLRNLMYVYSTMYKSFKNFKLNCLECDESQLKIVDLMFASRLDYLNTFFQGKQVVKLSEVVITALENLQSASTNLKEINVFNTVEGKKIWLLKEIEDAKHILDNIQQTKMKELREAVDTNFEALLFRMEELREKYQGNALNLEAQKKGLRDGLEKKANFGIIKTICDVVSVFLPTVIGMIGNTVLGSGTSFLGTGRAKRSMNLIDQAREAIIGLEEKIADGNLLWWKPSVQAFRNIFAAENEVGEMIGPENRRIITDLLNETHQNDASDILHLDAIPNLFYSLDKDLNMKMDSFENDDNVQSKVVILENVKTDLRLASHVANATEAIVKVFQDNSRDKRKLQQVVDAIKQNSVALQELATVERSLIRQIKPMLTGMLSAFEQYKSKAVDYSTFLMLFQGLEVKKYARKLISTLGKFVKTITQENEDLAHTIFELEDFLTVMISAFDKIQEMQNRAELASFLGQIQGGECMSSLTSDPQTCNLFLDVAAKIKTNEVVRESIQIFTAYQQVLFPYGGEKINVIHSTLTFLNQYPNQSRTINDTLPVLREMLQGIKKDLSNENNLINEERDRNISMAQFNSKYISSRSFFVWPNSKHSKAIRGLLNGEQVTLVASVFEPGTRNAVKFKSIMLNFTSEDPNVVREMNGLLENFEMEMIHRGESHYRCGSSYYVIGGQSLTFRLSFEVDQNGDYITKNKVLDKLNYGDVPLSPYTVWKFRLIHRSEKDLDQLRSELSVLAEKVDLELVGSGYFLEEGAPICDTDLGTIYNSF